MLLVVAVPRGAGAQVAAEFRDAVAKETSRGLTLEETRVVETGGGRYLAAIFRYPEGDKEHPDFQAFRLYYLADGARAAVERAAYDEQRVFFGTFDNEELVSGDVNRDGVTELVLSAANGGNCWNCSRVLVYALGAGDARLIAGGPMRLENVMGDDAPELLLGDTRWEFYDDFSHAGSPGGTLVYTWRDGKYVFAGPEAAAFYRRAAEALREELPEAAARVDASDPYSDERYMHAALSLYLIAAYTGQTEAARETLRKMLSEHAPSAEMRDRRKRILEDFLSGESARRLEEPKPGDAMPISTGI